MDDDDPRSTRPDDDSLLREIAAAPPLAVPQDLATFVLLEPGTIVDGEFQIESRLGAGGMGVVYAARDLKLDREVALKLMRLDRGPSQLGDKLPDVFEREARATARLNHANIVTLHQFGNWNGLLYLVLERLRGETLHARMERGAISLGDGVAIVELVARALVHTHAAGITHRDLKPQNVFLLADGGVKVLDFGVSGLGRAPDMPRGAAGSRDRSTLSLAGTPGYMAPEQWDGTPQDTRTDIFAVGVMLYQLATGELPFATRPVELDEVPPSLAGKVPDEAIDLVPLVAACLEPRRERRLASATELALRLHAIAGALATVDSAAHGIRATALATARVNRGTRARRAGVIAGLVLAGSAIAIGALGSRGRSDDCAAASRLAGVWDADTRARLGAKFGSSATWDAIARVLDSYTGQWAPLREAACRADDEPRQKCLDERLTALSAYVRDADATRQELALESARGLPALAECSDPTYLAGIAHPEQPVPRDPDALVPFAVTVAGRGRDIVHAATFADGELVITGTTSIDARIAGTPLVPPPGQDGFEFVARIGHDGRVRWARVLDRVVPLAIAASGGTVYLAGSFIPGGSFGASSAPMPNRAAGTPADGMIASLDAATGDVRWVHGIEASTVGKIHAIEVDRDGNLYAAGDFGGRATFGGATAHDAGEHTEVAPFVASWTAAGALRWVQTGRDVSVSKTWAMATSGDSVVFASYVHGAGTFGGQAIGDAGCLFGRLSRETGAIAWLRQERGADNRCVADAIAISGDRVATSGRRYFATNGSWVAELALGDGSVRWVKPVGTSEHDVVKALAFTKDGTLYAGGHFETATLAVAGKTLVSNGSWDGVVVAFDAKGNGIGAVGLGGATSDLVRWLIVGPAGEIVIGGRFEGALRVGDRTLRGRSGMDGYAVELSPRLLTAPPPPASSASP